MGKTLIVRHGHITSEDGILDGADLVEALGSSTYKDWVLKHVATSRPGQLLMRGKDIDFTPTGTPVNAEIMWGRWIANCECGGQENVDKNTPWFFCLSCFNESNESKNKKTRYVRPLVFPVDPVAVESLLMERKFDKRHWLKHETIEDLVVQNEILVAEKLMAEEAQRLHDEEVIALEGV